MVLFHRKVKKRLAAVEHLLDDYELPSFPHVIADALGQLSDPNVAMSDVANMLELDPGISVQLLRQANSAATGLRNPVQSLHQAVTILGRNQVEAALISTAARACIPDPKSPIFDTERFWRSAASRAVVATSVSAILEPTKRSETFTGALLLDMALPILVDHLEGYEQVLMRWYEGEVTDLAQAEHEVFGWDHAAVAAKIGTLWGFPESLLSAIAFHHDEGGHGHNLGIQFVAGWHETDPAIGRKALIRQAAEVPELRRLDVDAVVSDAMEQVGEVAGLFS